MRIFPSLFYLSCVALLGLRVVRASSVSKSGSVCTVHASPDTSDDAPGIIRAFQLCNKDASVIFDPSTFHIESVMNTTGLENVFVDLPGTLLVSNQYHL